MGVSEPWGLQGEPGAWDPGSLGGRTRGVSDPPAWNMGVRETGVWVPGSQESGNL